MRKLAVVLALASTALASPALARDDAWYVGAEFGGMIVEDIEYDITSATSGTGTIDHDYGYDAGGVAGYDFGGFRLEAEVAYKSAVVDGYTSTVVTPANNGTTTVNVAPGSYDFAGGRSTALSFMVNGLLDFGDDNGISGYAGGGAGVSKVKLAGYRLRNTGTFLDAEEDVFSWQLIAGARVPVSKHIDLGLKYRYFQTATFDTDDRAGRQNRLGLATHSILFGATYNFGAPAPLPPPPLGGGGGD